MPPTAFPAVEIRHGDGKSEPAEYTRITNPISGGQFSTVIYDQPLELKQDTQLELLVRPSADTHLSLIVTINGQAGEVPVTGPKDVRRPYTFLLAPSDIQPIPAMPGWLSVKAPIGFRAMSHFPHGEKLTVTSVAIASPYDSIEEIAGLGVNRAGATVDFTKLQVTQSQTKPQAELSYRMPNPVINGHRIIHHGRQTVNPEI